MPTFLIGGTSVSCIVGGVAEDGVQGAALPGKAADTPSFVKIIVVVDGSSQGRRDVQTRFDQAGADSDNAPSILHSQLSTVDSLPFVASSSATALSS